MGVRGIIAAAVLGLFTLTTSAAPVPPEVKALVAPAKIVSYNGNNELGCGTTPGDKVFFFASGKVVTMDSLFSRLDELSLEHKKLKIFREELRTDSSNRISVLKRLLLLRDTNESIIYISNLKKAHLDVMSAYSEVAGAVGGCK